MPLSWNEIKSRNKAVDLCYRPQPFTNERNRIEFLFELYEAYRKPLLKGGREKNRIKLKINDTDL